MKKYILKLIIVFLILFIIGTVSVSAVNVQAPIQDSTDTTTTSSSTISNLTQSMKNVVKGLSSTSAVRAVILIFTTILRVLEIAVSGCVIMRLTWIGARYAFASSVLKKAEEKGEFIKTLEIGALVFSIEGVFEIIYRLVSNFLG